MAPNSAAHPEACDSASRLMRLSDRPPLRRTSSWVESNLPALPGKLARKIVRTEHIGNHSLVAGKAPPPKTETHTLKFFGTLLLILLIAMASAAYVLYTPFGPSTETFVDIAPGTGTQAIAAQLQHTGIIRSQYAFDLLRKLKRGTLKAGEYRFAHPVPMTEIYARLMRGDVYTRALTIPEGFNIFEIAHAIEAAGLGSSDA